tara:strand:- start:162 stop:407 length:246 start_codon:yes stop_codon:yes gene_type:complete
MKKITNDMYIINGVYGEDEGRQGHWAAIATEGAYIYNNKKYNLKVDFSMKYKKSHEPIYYALKKERKIEWQDGNEWKQMYG